ncbi:MAG TPA: hypothetical protein VIF60_18825 [Burkholderiaceae bacterium]|jgi:hypothetical protein
MQLSLDFKAIISLPQADSHWFSSLHAVDANRAFLHFITAKRFDQQHWLVEVTRESGQVNTNIMEIPVELRTVPPTEEDDDPVDAFAIFILNGKVGILQGDSRIHLFDSLDAKPRTMTVVKPFPQVKSTTFGWKASFIPISCGKASGNLIPVVFQRPTEPVDYACFYSLLEINEAAGSASWVAATAKSRTPMHVRYERSNARHRDTFHLGPILHDLAWDGKRLAAWVIGERESIKRWGMSYSALLRCNMDGSKAELICDVAGECYGKLLQVDNLLILTPISRAAPRKGKQSLLNLGSLVEEPIELPRGLSTARVLDLADQTFWGVAGAKWLNINSAVPVKEGEPFTVLAMRASNI